MGMPPGIAQSTPRDSDAKPGPDRLRIATKYVASTERHFAAKGQQVEIIKLYGSMELAPLVGLANLIVDLVYARLDPRMKLAGGKG